MVKVFILGATGFIGRPAALQLVSTGHQVYGLARNAAKAKSLAAEEVIPVLGDALQTESWIHLVKEVDVIINALGGSVDIKEVSEITLEAVSKAAIEIRPSSAPKLAYIYTSGTWVHGEDRENLKTDTSPITNPNEVVAWRPIHEQKVIKDGNVNGIVVRPSLLYGKSASLLADLFRGASTGTVNWPGTPGGRLATIHTDDLAVLYQLVAEKAPVLGGLIFDASNEQTESTDDFLNKLVKVSGAKGPYQYTQPRNAYEQALGSTTLLRPNLARALLGWQPRKASLTDGLTTYFAAFKANL
ncbi:NAD(P)-binding protein [Violaceomyces palustris]|uniref:NAD(P)-binding protein n=1 Tax=Violaceomyces palustris TaxID=1673888 RepID=A0ACD0NT15_9BASI|nr:NAD(P)-binding protein [Violaceomyces palustris]